MIALGETIRAKDIPIAALQPICCVLFARTRPSSATPHGTTCSDYCVYSANPVGRLVLYLCGYRDEERQQLSDATCTALQLANFWQDVSRDLEKGRIYIPLEALAAARPDGRRYRQARRFDERYVALMKISDCAHTRDFSREGYAARASASIQICASISNCSAAAASPCSMRSKPRVTTRSNTARRSAKCDASSLAGRALVGHARFPAARPARRSSRRAAALPCRARPAGEQRRRTIAPAAAAQQDCGSRAIARPTPNATASPAPRAAASISRFIGLPKQKRNALCALYAFMRLVDNVSDEPGRSRSQAPRPRALARHARRSRCAAAPAAPRNSARARRYDRAFRNSRRAIFTT